MKLKLHKKSKNILVLILILLMILSGLQLFLSLAVTKMIKTEKPTFEANCVPNVTYQVVINPNEVYPGSSQKEGEIYSKKILNYIQADFNVNYIGNKPVPLDIEYQLVAKVNGYQGDDPEKTIYWSKTFPLSSVKKIKEDAGGTWSKKERINFQLGNYDAFAVRAKEITGMDVQNEVLVSMIGKIIAHSGEEDLETPFDVHIRIPLMEDVFSIAKSGTDPIEDNLSVTVETQKPVDLMRVIPYGSILGISFIGLIILIFFTRQPNHDEIILKKANSTIKNYGSRIVALQNIPMMNYRQHYKVHSMKDMIKIADELQKPIFYEVDSATIVKNYEFHVIENDTIYSLFLDSAEA